MAFAGGLIMGMFLGGIIGYFGACFIILGNDKDE
jgi:hypothetical protein